MLNVSNELALQRAYHLKQHQIKLKEIQKKSKSIDNTLSPLNYPLPRQTGYKALYWTNKVSRENKLLLDRLIKIRKKPFSISFEKRNLKYQTTETQKNLKKPFDPSSIPASLSTKNMLKDYTKYKNYLDMRSKLFKQRIISLKKLENTPIYHFSHKSEKIDKQGLFSSP